MASGRALLHIEDLAARDVVVDEAVHQTVELVALAHELASNGIDLGVGHPIIERFLLDTVQRSRQHQ
jgi:hypothetical protein